MHVTSGSEIHVPIVSIVIVGWRDAPLLVRCLTSLAENRPTVPYEVLVVLNEPSAPLVSSVRQGFPDVRTWSFSTNLGFGGAVNFGAENALGEFVVLLNDDCVVHRDWLEPLVDTARRRGSCGAVGSTFLHPDGTLQEAGSVLWNDGSSRAVGDGESGTGIGYRFERRVDYCSGGSLLVRRDAWLAVGGLDDRYYPAYYEDVDLSLRLDAAGWETWYQPASCVTHSRSTSTNHGFRNYLMLANREVFRDRWASELVDRCGPGELEQAMWRARGRPGRVLVIDDMVPAPSLGSGFGRMFDCLLALASDTTLAVDFHPRQFGEQTAAQAAILSQYGVRIVTDLQAHLDTDGVDVDVVLMSRPHNYEIFEQLLDRMLTHVPVVYDAEAVYYRRAEMQAALAKDPTERAELERAASRMRELEERLFARADQVVCISDDEARLAAEHAPGPVTVVEAWLTGAQPTPSGFRPRRDIGFVAGWAAGKGSPNADGLLWFAREVLPIVRAKMPWCRLLVTGASPPQDVSWLHGESVVFLGGVADLHAFYDQIRVAISPVRFGAGVKLKSIEALQSGVPLVATVEGAAGLDPGLIGAFFASDDPETFARCLISLLTDETAWEQSRGIALRASSAEHRDGLTIAAWPEIVRKHLTDEHARSEPR